MDQNRKSSFSKSVIYFLVMIYPILPLNYYIGFLSYSNICSLMIVGIYFFGYLRLKVINPFRYNKLFWYYLVVYAVFGFTTSSFTNGIAVVVSLIMVSFVLIQIISDESDVYQVIELIIIASVVLSNIGIFESLSHQYLFQSELFDGWSDSFRYGVLRCAGPFGHPINFALYQAISAILIFYRLNNGTLRRKKRIWYRVAYILAIISMILAVSRLANLFFVVAQILLILHLGVKKVVKVLLISSLGIILCTVIFNFFGFEVLNLFSDFIVSLMEMFGVDRYNSESNIIGFGNRFDLYGWVVVAVGDNYIFGKGIDAKFAYKMAEWFTKTSIEVHYLNIYFMTGLFGLSTLIISYIGTIRFFWKKRNLFFYNEQKINFFIVLTIIFMLYYMSLFGVQESDLTRLYCELVSLGIACFKIHENKFRMQKWKI